MGSDRARVSYDPKQHYRSVVMQQGRVTLEADWNEAETISSEELRQETIEIVGRAGTPDGGYQVISIPAGNQPDTPFDFAITPGTAYAGGLRLSTDQLQQPVLYSTQSDWLDHDSEPDWVMPDNSHPAGKEFIYLYIREQEVSAVEDSALLDVALGGPDTTQRTRMIQRIARLSTESTSCASGLKALEDYWGSKGLAFDPATMRLTSHASLQASFQNITKPDPCEPEAVGGYLGADNQLIRIQITGQNTLVWGFDDASFLYRAGIDASREILTLQSQPVDAFHQPQAGQAVEVLRSAAQLSNEEYVASATGVVETLTTPYNPDTMQIKLPNALPSYYTDPSTPRPFLRVWQQQLTFTPGQAVELGTTGLFVTLSTNKTSANTPYPFHVGDYWLIAVRPSTPAKLYPQRYLDGPQPPDGPRMWACPLAAIEWDNSTLKVDESCLPPFDNLVDLTKRRGAGCCTVQVSPDDLTAGKTLQSVLDSATGKGPVKICLAPGTYGLTQPLQLGSQHSNFTIEACPGSATFQAAARSESVFQQGLITVAEAANVTFRGLTFVLPPPVNLGTGDGAASSVGLRPVDCTNLSVEDCTFAFPGGLLQVQPPPVVAGILASGECSGFRLVRNSFEVSASRFEHPVDLRIGFAVFPSSTLQPAPGTAATATARFVGSRLDDALLRDNFFETLTVPVLVYADCGLVKLESNTVHDSSNGFMFHSMGLLAATFNMANVTVDQANAAQAVQLHNALFSILANPQFQIASAVLRGFPLPPNFDLSKAQTITPAPGAATDITRVQGLFDRLLPAAPAPSAPVASSAAALAPARVVLAGNAGVLREHPLGRAFPVPPSVVAINRSFSAVENQALAAAAAPRAPLALHLSGNDVDAETGGQFSGYGLSIQSLSQDDRDALNLTNNTLISVTSTQFDYVTNIAGVSRCTVTSNVILNEAENVDFRRSLSVTTPKPPMGNGAITGNVLRGEVHLDVLPPPPAPLNTWAVFNSLLQI